MAAGIRAPINSRVVKGASSRSRGCASTKYSDDTCLPLGDFFHWGGDNFFDYRPTDRKSELRPKEPSTVNMFGKCAIARSRYFESSYGGGGIWNHA